MMRDEELPYVRQNNQFATLTKEKRVEWFVTCTGEGRNGYRCTFFRYSINHPSNPTVGLVEGWWKRPAEMGDVRWQHRRKYPVDLVVSGMEDMEMTKSVIGEI
jgi:hypothetical protein